MALIEEVKHDESISPEVTRQRVQQLDARIETVQREIQELETRIRQRKQGCTASGRAVPSIPADAPSASASGKSAPPKLNKWYSMKSQLAINELDQVRQRLDTLGTTVKAAEDEIAVAKAGGDGQIDPALRDLLAQVHGDTMRLLSSGGPLLTTGDAPTPPLDAITTSELESGRVDARAERKALVLRAEALSERVQAAITSIDEHRVADH